MDEDRVLSDLHWAGAKRHVAVASEQSVSAKEHFIVL